MLLAFLIDITGSTGRFAAGVVEAIRMILGQITARVRGLSIYLYGGGDLDCGQECTLLASGVPVAEAIATVERLSFQGGGDSEETHADSVETVITTTPWELDRQWRNVLVVFLTADSKPSRSGLTTRQLGEKLQRQGIQLFVVAEDYPFARDLVDAAAGLFFPISNNPDPTQMQQIAGAISQTLLLTVASPATKPMTRPLPAP